MTLLLELLVDASTKALEVHSTRLRQGPATDGLLSPNPSQVVRLILLRFRENHLWGSSSVRSLSVLGIRQRFRQRNSGLSPVARETLSTFGTTFLWNTLRL